MQYDPNPPTAEEIAEAYRFKYGLAQEANQGLRPLPGRDSRQPQEDLPRGIDAATEA